MQRAESAMSGEEDFRLLVQAAKDVMLFVTDASGRIILWPDGAANVLGWLESDVAGRNAQTLIDDANEKAGSRSLDLSEAVRPGGVSLQGWYKRKDGVRLFVDGSIRPLGDKAGSLVWTGCDVTALRMSLERQKSITIQLQHRIRNILASVRSLVQRSSRTSDTIEDMSMHLEDRIDSIARTQLMLARRSTEDLDLEYAIREELLAHAAPDKQLSIKGPAVSLSDKAIEIITFAIHELATNAVKFGALQTSKGRISVDWEVIEGEDEKRLRLTWAESGVQVMSMVPRREGFGVELITRRIPYELAGTGILEHLPGGIRATIEFPLRPGESILAPEMGNDAYGP